MRRPTSILLLLISGFLVIGGLTVAKHDRQVASELTRAEGQVVSYRDVTTGGGRRQKTRFLPRVEFTASDGHEYTFESHVALTKMSYAVGQRVTVLYDDRSETPVRGAEIEGAGLKMPFVIYCIAFGMGLVGVVGAFRSGRVA